MREVDLCPQVLNWLQFGATPVGVGDGAMPFEKAGVLRARGILKNLPEQRSEVPGYSEWPDAWQGRAKPCVCGVHSSLRRRSQHNM
jgi:hypothetical protein